MPIQPSVCRTKSQPGRARAAPTWRPRLSPSSIVAALSVVRGRPPMVSRPKVRMKRGKCWYMAFSSVKGDQPGGEDRRPANQDRPKEGGPKDATVAVGPGRPHRLDAEHDADPGDGDNRQRQGPGGKGRVQAVQKGGHRIPRRLLLLLRCRGQVPAA